ncbi:MAG: monovalent cation/H+ antiporter complex subunit F [Spirochaetia bacterium]|jgi:multicomponent Na+:H+ antiporter subunit F|nr:monovalent cation/H+ antiporter complex subunit F [Spirochaetia bacterium]
MKDLILHVLQWSLIALGLATLPALLLGPSSSNRLIALNTLGGIVLAFLVVYGLAKASTLYLDVALVYDIFGFLGILAITRLSRYGGKEV